MGIINRDKSRAEKRDVFDYNLVGTVTGSTYSLAQVPYLGLAAGGYFTAIGLSGTPVHSLAISRFIAGVGGGATLIGLGATITPTAWGTSGGVFLTFGTSGGVGSTLGPGVTVLMGDQIILNALGANAACAQASVSLVIECLQDIKTHYGF